MYLRRDLIVRLACMKHAASVRPEPGSNSPLSEKLCPSRITNVVFRHLPAFAFTNAAPWLHTGYAMLDFVCCPFILTRINKFFIVFFHVCVKRRFGFCSLKNTTYFPAHIAFSLCKRFTILLSRFDCYLMFKFIFANDWNTICFLQLLFIGFVYRVFQPQLPSYIFNIRNQHV